MAHCQNIPPKSSISDLQELALRNRKDGCPGRAQRAEAIQALTTRDRRCPLQIIATDGTLDVMQRNIEESAIETIARRQPVGGDLRQIISILRIANEIERIGDLAKNISKRIIAIHGEDAPRGQCAGSATWLLSCWFRCGMSLTVLRAVMSRRRSKFGHRTKTSTVYAQFISGASRLHDGKVRRYVLRCPLAILHENLERMGDHTTNIAEAIHYM